MSCSAPEPSAWECPLCSKRIYGVKAINGHLRMVYLDANDKRRCDYNIPQTEPSLGPPTQPILGPPTTTATTITGPVANNNDMFELARRPAATKIARRMERKAYIIPCVRNGRKLPCTRDLCGLQRTFQKLTQDVWGLASPEFWKFFLPIHSMSCANIDTALAAARSTFLCGEALKAFPPTRRYTVYCYLCIMHS